MLKPSTHNTCGRQTHIRNNSTTGVSFLRHLLALQVSAAPFFRPDGASDIQTCSYHQDFGRYVEWAYLGRLSKEKYIFEIIRRRISNAHQMKQEIQRDMCNLWWRCVQLSHFALLLVHLF